MGTASLSPILTSILILALIKLVAKILNWVWFRPKKLEKILREQGLNGNPYRFLVGDMKDLMSVVKAEKSRSIKFSDDLPSHMFPYYHQLRSKYGPNSFVWFGPDPQLLIADPQLLKEILTNIDVFHKPVPEPIGESISGGGLSFLEGEKWAKHRKIINPAFHMEKLKDMTPVIQMSCSKMIDKWDALVSSHGNSRELDVWPYLEELSGDVISRTAFGSNHEEGRKIFELQNELVDLVLQLVQLRFIPGWSYLPTNANRRMKAISREIKSLLMGIIKRRETAMERGEIMGGDLLGILMESNFSEIKQHGNNMGMTIEDVVEECKLFYFAGSDTTSSLLVWTMVLLSKHQDWQALAREEVLRVFGRGDPTFNGLNRLKIVTMILQEVLRLYPPVPLTVRSPTKTTKLGNLTLPKGVNLMLLTGLLHHDPEIWGDNVHEFKPERFSGGTASVTKTQFTFIPFSLGPRICIGQHFAMIEVKTVLAMILQRFSFELSSSYLHAPFPILTLQPQHGASIVLHKL